MTNEIKAAAMERAGELPITMHEPAALTAPKFQRYLILCDGQNASITPRDDGGYYRASDVDAALTAAQPVQPATPELPEPVAHIYPSNLERFQESETFAHAYSVAVGNPDERSVPLYTLSQLVDYAAIAQPVQPAPAKPTATAIELFKLVLAHVAAYKAALKDPYDETAEPRQAFRRAHDALHSAINDLTVEVETLRAITQPVQPDAELECTRSHPHENMDALCKLRTVIARLENEKAAQPAPTARVPLSDQEIKITSADIERLAEQAGLLLAGSDFVSNRDQTRAAVAFVKLLDAAIATKGAKT